MGRLGDAAAYIALFIVMLIQIRYVQLGKSDGLIRKYNKLPEAEKKPYDLAFIKKFEILLIIITEVILGVTILLILFVPDINAEHTMLKVLILWIAAYFLLNTKTVLNKFCKKKS